MVICPYHNVKETVQIPDFENPITVLVGPQEKKYYMHKNVLAASSKFFEAALRPGVWKEEQEGVIRMPEDNHEIFTMYAEWLYTGTCRTTFIEAETDKGEESDAYYDAEETDGLMLAEAYIFGDKVQVSRFKARVMDLLVSRLTKSGLPPSYELITFVYKSTVSGSPLRRLLCDNYLHTSTCPDTDLEGLEEPEFFRDLAKFSRIAFQGLQSEEGIGKPYEADICFYHDHDHDID